MHAPVGMMHQPPIEPVRPGEYRRLQRVQRQPGARVIDDLPTHNGAGKQIGNRGGIAESIGGVGLSDIGDPATIQRCRSEIPLQQVCRPRQACVSVVLDLLSAATVERTLQRLDRSVPPI